MRRGSMLLMLSLACAAGCGVHRSLTIKSDPPGALVYLNGLEVGRTPVTRDFIWYGVYDVELRKDGYDTLKTTGDVRAPWWQYVPLDFFAELVPFHLHDRQRLNYPMRVASTRAADPDEMIRRAGDLREQLQSSSRTKPPAPATTPATTRSSRRASTTRASTIPSTTHN